MWDNLVKKIRPGRPRAESPDIHTAHSVDAQAGSEEVEVHEEGLRQQTKYNEFAAMEEAALRSRTGSGANARPPHERRKLNCPACQTAMQLERLGRVEIDRCPDCGGIFLDRGELEQISGRNPSTYVPASQNAEQQSERDFLIYTPHGLSDHVRDSHSE